MDWEYEKMILWLFSILVVIMCSGMIALAIVLGR